MRPKEAKTFTKNMEKIQKEAKQLLIKTAEKMKAQYDKHQKPSRPYKEGDMVYVEATNHKTD